MKLPAGFGELDFTDWIRGLVSAFVSGGASAVTTAVVAPALTPELAAGTAKFFILVGSVFVMSGVIGMANFLRTKPIPDLKTVTKMAQTVTELSPTSIKVNTVTETHTEPVTEPKP
jgi:hypothetical protein